jgi:hypothetical protein
VSVKTTFSWKPSPDPDLVGYTYKLVIDNKPPANDVQVGKDVTSITIETPDPDPSRNYHGAHVVLLVAARNSKGVLSKARACETVCEGLVYPEPPGEVSLTAAVSTALPVLNGNGAGADDNAPFFHLSIDGDNPHVKQGSVGRIVDGDENGIVVEFPAAAMLKPDSVNRVTFTTKDGIDKTVIPPDQSGSMTLEDFLVKVYAAPPK